MFLLGKMTVAIGGAGDGDLIDFINQDLVKHLLRETFDLQSLESILDAYAKKIFKENIRPYAGFHQSLIPSANFLIGVALDGNCGLFKWEKNYVYRVPMMQHTSIGIGVLQSEQLLSDIQFHYPSDWMLFFAVRMMQNVKQLVNGCGGKTEISFISNQGSHTSLGVFVVDEIEHMADIVDEFLSDHVLSFIANRANLKKESISSQLDNLRKGIEHLRERYLNLRPGVFIDSPKPQKTSQQPKGEKNS
ncbi:MAG: hypothetical protein WB007_10775 [Candidatus Acidiferrales bacterium]